MNNFVMTESAIHYACGLLDRYAEKHPSKKHQDTLKEFRDLSNQLLETLEQPIRISIHRHNLKDK